MKKKFTFAILLAWGIFMNAQVGINTTTPNGATVLDIHSNEKGILIPKLTDAERDANLADNNPATVPPAGVVNPALSEGTLIFNTTTNAFQYWDGTLWKQLFVTSSSLAGNDGVVKINSGAGGVKPSYSLNHSGNSYGPKVQVLYNTPLIFAPSPTTSWPETSIPFPGNTSTIYQGTTPATQRWRENPVPGQVHVWRVITTVTPGDNATGSVRAIFENPDSGFNVTSVQVIPGGSKDAGNTLTFYFYTIADPDSLAPGAGYQLFVQSDISVTLTVESITRISLFKD
ncbi:hypothetical protein [Kaistella polysaccharea]|uniref:hypothetical protein n=1 Tax=Kaistella polysaccharea TaxID=2878534 RepID=UPI001CF46607|nr:hypothetical protein [Kaistella polysaccharea]